MTVTVLCTTKKKLCNKNKQYLYLVLAHFVLFLCKNRMTQEKIGKQNTNYINKPSVRSIVLRLNNFPPYFLLCPVNHITIARVV